MSYVWTPPPNLVEQSNLTAFLRATGEVDFDTLARRADADPAWLMHEVFRFCDVRFYRPYDQKLDLSRGHPWARWCVGGTTNIVLNCIDRHRNTPVWNQTFLVWEGEDKRERRTLSYREFSGEVDRLARALLTLGIGKGDVVAIYMPNLPETFAAFFAILKIGAIVMPLFSGYGPSPIQSRLNHGEAKAVITANGTWRRGAAEIRARRGPAGRSERPLRDRRGAQAPRHRQPHVGRSRPLVARDRPRRREGNRHAGNAGRGPRHSALYVRHDGRAEGLHLDPYRLHRHDGDTRHHYLRRFQALRPLFVLQ